jgi:hypothetical protein
MGWRTAGQSGGSAVRREVCPPVCVARHRASHYGGCARQGGRRACGGQHAVRRPQRRGNATPAASGPANHPPNRPVRRVQGPHCLYAGTSSTYAPGAAARRSNARTQDVRSLGLIPDKPRSPVPVIVNNHDLWRLRLSSVPGFSPLIQQTAILRLLSACGQVGANRSPLQQSLPADTACQARDHHMGRRSDHADHSDGCDARVVCHSGWRRPCRLCRVPAAL